MIKIWFRLVLAAALLIGPHVSTSVWAETKPSTHVAKKKKGTSQKATLESAPKIVTPQPVVVPSNPFKPRIETAALQALLIDYTTGTVLLEKNASVLMHPSSMTKIMTAYMIFEKLKAEQINLETLFPVSEMAWRMGGSKMYVPLGGTVSIEDLLKGIIIQSGNDACTVAAEGLGGSEDNFSQDMTQRAREIGAVNTTFMNASGWPHPEHLTTAHDLALIARRLISDFPEFYHLFGEKEYIYNNIRQWNRNRLLYKNIGCDGIKTGHTDDGGFGIVASVRMGDRRLILVVNGLPSDQARALEAHKLLLWGMQTFDNYPLFKTGQLVENIPVWLGTEGVVSATVQQDVVITLPRAARKGLKVDIQYQSPIAAPIQKNAVIGKLIVTYPGQTQPHEVPLVAAVPVDKGNFFKRIRDSISYLVWGKA